MSIHITKMVKIIILLQIAFAVSSVVSKPKVGEEINGFAYLGSFKSDAVRRSSLKSYNSHDENNYYVSIVPTVWQTANDDCKIIFGPNQGLVAIETNEEWDFLKRMLENYGLGSTYWTSGKYDTDRLEWIWSLNNQTVNNPNPPWSQPSNPTAVLRILIYHTSRYDANWLTVVDTDWHRYICEVR